MGLVFARFADTVVNLEEVESIDLGSGPVAISYRNAGDPEELSAAASEAARAFFGTDRFVSGIQGFRIVVDPCHPCHREDGPSAQALADEQAGEAVATGA